MDGWVGVGVDRLYLYKGRSQWDWWACVALSVVGDGGHGLIKRNTLGGTHTMDY